MPKTVEELRQDADELKRLIDLSTRQSVKDMLSIEVRRLESDISFQLKDNAFNLEKKATPSAAAPPRCYDVKLTNYAWDQSDKFFKIFVTLNYVQHHPTEKVQCIFTERSVELSVKELDGKNHNLIIKNLSEMIDVAKSHWKVKTDSIVIFLAKCKPITWTGVTTDDKKAKEAKAPKMSPPGPGDDPQASMMEMMKQLYQDGDDDMKRQIAKSFSEGRGGKPDLGL